MKQLLTLLTTVILSLPCFVFAKTLSSAKSASMQKKEAALLVELTGKDISKESDMALYSAMVTANEKNDEIGFKSRLQSLMTRFPQSVYADNALFLAGRRAVDTGNYAEAIRFFGRIEREYPRSNRIIAARFAKAMTYKKMNLPEFAKKNLVEIRKKFPGSPESFRASAELKIMK